MKRGVILVAIFCFLLQSCSDREYKAQEEIEYLQNKLDKIKALTEEASGRIADLAEENEDCSAAYEMLDNIQMECDYREYDFYWGE